MRDRIILVIGYRPDDEALVLRATKTIVPFPIVFAHDGAEALDILFGTGDFAGRGLADPLLVLLDLKIPKVPGFDVLRRMKGDGRTKRIPVVVWSDHNESDINESYHLGANSFVSREIPHEANQVKLMTTVEYWLRVNILPTSRLCRE